MLALVLLATTPAFTESGVGLLSDYDQIMTSSTLQWVTGTGDVKQLENAVLGGFELIDGGKLVIQENKQFRMEQTNLK